jgi:O-antigen ligase
MLTSSESLHLKAGSEASAQRGPVLLADVAFFLGLFGIAWLWNETSFSYSFFWTAGVALVVGMAATRYGGWDALRGEGALAGWFFLVYPALCVASYLLVSHSDGSKEEQMVQDAKELILCLLYFALGHVAARHVGTLAIRLTFAACFLYILSKREVFTNPDLFYEVGIERGQSLNYQHVGDAFVIAGILVIQQFTSARTRIVLFLLSLVVLAVTPSRSSAVLGAVCLFLATFPGQWRRALIVVVALAVFAWLAGDSRVLAELLAGTRLEALLFPQEDVSFLQRNAALREGLDAIARHPLIGLYQFQIDAFDNAGLYIHNILNTWAQAGIVPFLLLGGFLVSLAWRTVRARARTGSDTAAILLLFAVMSWAYSRTTMSALVFTCVGYALGSLALAARTQDTEQDEHGA